MLIKTKGFSLVELVAVVAIAGILLALAVPSFSEMILNAKIRNLAGSIVNGLNVAKAEAVRRNKMINFSLSSVGNGWTVSTFPTNGDAVETIMTEKNENSDRLNVESSGDTEVIFNSLGRLAAGSSSMWFSVESPSSGICAQESGNNRKGVRCMNIEISSGGQVRMCDPALPSGDIQGCLFSSTGSP